MNQYITGSIIRKLREEKRMTQAELAERIGVSDKAVSKWETGRGYPDIALVELLAKELGISVIELMSGEDVVNTNQSLNMRRLKFYVCPICGNVIVSVGEAVVSCCGVTLPALDAEEADSAHAVKIEKSEDEYYATVSHDMSKMHYISFVAAVKDNSIELIKLYPESAAEARFKTSRTREMYYYCNQHGLFRVRVK